MHFLQNLMRYMIPIVPMVLGNNEDVPIGVDRVITSRGGFVITARSNFVTAKSY